MIGIRSKALSRYSGAVQIEERFDALADQFDTLVMTGTRLEMLESSIRSRGILSTIPSAEEDQQIIEIIALLKVWQDVSEFAALITIVRNGAEALRRFNN